MSPDPSWSSHHSESEALASAAEAAARRGETTSALELYGKAAKAEHKALGLIGREKTKTLGITAVSAVALAYKAKNFSFAENVAHNSLSQDPLPEFARSQLQTLLQIIWTTRAADNAGVQFVPGDVLVSVKGGEVVYGGAPLDLIVTKVSEVQAVFFRVIEMLLGRPFRKRGPPTHEVQSILTPWLFQVPAGSYQFAIRIQEPPQLDIFPEARPKVEAVTHKFLEVLRASAGDAESDLPQVIPDPDYRNAFLRLTRNLAPTGKKYESLELVDASSPASRVVSLSKEARAEINALIRRDKPAARLDPRGTMLELRGLLRGVHLDEDWLELVPDPTTGAHVRIHDAGEVLDDVIGPLVNHRVVVTVEVGRNNRYSYRDIESDE